MKNMFSSKKGFSRKRMVLLCGIMLFSLPMVFAETLETEVQDASKASDLSSDKVAGVFVNSEGMAIKQTTTQYEGVIVDAATMEPIIGVNVLIKGTSVGVITDLDGRFKIKAEPGQILEVTYIGYQKSEVKLGKLKILSIELKEDSKVLGEVVVTAFGVGQKKESVVGSVAQIKPAELKVPSSNLSNSFAGRLSGVVSVQRGGEPGSDGSQFFIRGISTLNASARSPLIIIDGVEASAGDLNALDSEVIDGFSILKDATATAMYGTRGANGVMIVTTRSGANLEKAAISVRVEGNVSMPTEIPEFVDGPTYMELYNEAVNNYSSGSKLFTQEQINGTRNNLNPYLYPNVDWYDELFKKASFNQRVNFNVRGGGKKMDYFVNANVNHETGMMRGRSKEFYSYDNNIDIMRYTFQNNLNLHLTKTATVSMNLGVELRDSHGPITSTSNIFSAVMNNNPADFPVLYPTGSLLDAVGTTSEYLKWGAYSGGIQGASYNPLAELVKGYKDAFTSTVRANIKYDQKLDFLTKGLKFGVLISFKNWSSTTVNRDRAYNKYEMNTPTYDENGNISNYILTPFSGVENNYTLGTKSVSTGDRSYYIQATLNYDRTFKDVHNVSVMLLYNQDEWNTNNPGENLISSLPKRKVGVAARFSYDYDHKYLAEINMGYNGSENFAKGHRYGFFPSIALGYNISQEKWFEKAKKVVNNLKVRASYGLVGNADAGTRFLYLPVVSLVSDPSFTTSDGEVEFTAKGPVYSRFGNDKITWEVGYKMNVGLDLGLFNSLNLSFDYFTELRKDIFQQNQTVPNYMGTSKGTVYGNYGEVKNYGFEMSADYGKQINKDWQIQVKGTFSFARNEVRKYAEGFNPMYPNKSIIGHSLEMNQGYIYAGHLFMDEAEIQNSPTQMIGTGVTAPGDIKYVDLPNVNGETDNLINTNDMQYMGYPKVPEIIYGFGPSIRWKNLDFSFFFQGVARTSLMMNNFHPFGTSINRSVLKFIADDHWNPQDQNIHAGYPRLTKIDNNTNTANSDYWLRNGAFLKLKNAEIGYTWKFLRAYISGTNLLTFSPFKYWDPEQGGGNGLSYPTQRVFNIGVQLSL